MLCHLDDFVEFTAMKNQVKRVPKRYIRDVQNPMERYNNVEFKIRYRFSKENVQHILLPLVCDKLAKINQRGLPISPLIQILLCLRFFATGSLQTAHADLRYISQPTVSRIIYRVAVCFAEKTQEFVKFPKSINAQCSNTEKFYQISRFPSVSGCIGCTHIPIKNPGGSTAQVFKNKNGVFSLNVQVVSGPNMEILNIVVRHPGSTQDSVIFDRSLLRRQLENGDMIGLLLGDNSYPSRSYLLTPLLNPKTEQEINYNKAHSCTSSIVKKLFALWKQRFPCLHRVLGTKIETSAAIIPATAVLHNIAIAHNLGNDFEGEYIPDVIPSNTFLDEDQTGVQFRRTFIQQHFTNK